MDWPKMNLSRCLGCSLVFLSLASSIAHGGQRLDIAPFARRCCVEDRHTSPLEFDYREAERAGSEAERSGDNRYIYGLQWAEERDVKEIRVHFRQSEPLKSAMVQYWFRTWPGSPPHMPSIEDPVDDPWQGRWLTATTQSDCGGAVCDYKFAPLKESENPRAKNLPGLDYRRTLKIRLVFNANPAIDKVEVFSGSVAERFKVRLQLGAGEKTAHIWDGDITIYNGDLETVQTWNSGPKDSAAGNHFHIATRGTPKGLIIGLDATQSSLPGSNDATIVTVHCGERTFSFAVEDVRSGPVYVPDFHVYVALASDPKPFSPSIVQQGQKIREKLANAPEQTYQRARREIPHLDPTEREGERLYLPLTVDASWQKFAFEWGGNIHVSKKGTKAKGNELRRLEWQGDRMEWQIGTGAPPTFRPGWKDSRLSVLDDYLPVAEAHWATDGIEYTEEGFATLLSGPLTPEDPGRSEETPAVLMIKITATNPNQSPAVAKICLLASHTERLNYKGHELVDDGGQLVRAWINWPPATTLSAASSLAPERPLQGVRAEIDLSPGQQKSVLIRLPFIPRLTEVQRRQLAAIDYNKERVRVVRYWRSALDNAVPFNVPEPRFNTFAKAAIIHIRISTTKDPESGLYMLPAASYDYQVFANEAAFQCVMLDALGNHQLAASYLNTLIRFQGSEKFEGTYSGDQKAVYHGVRVNATYDYTASEYNLDHGAVLWALAEHYLYTRDKRWLQATAPSMKRAGEWIINQRALTRVMDRGEKVPEYGLLPAGHLEDNSDWGHWFAVNDFAAAGIAALATALADADDPSALHFREEASAYRQNLREAIIRAAQSAPVVHLRDNTYVPWFGPRPYERIRLYGPIRVAYYSRYPQRILPLYRLSETREVLYGPMIHLSLNIFGSEEPVAQWVLDDWEDNATMSSSMGLNVHGLVDDSHWFSRGGMVFQANLQNPVLEYLRRHEISAAVRNLYNDFVACLYPEVNAFTEEYHQWVHGSGPFYKVPDEARFVNRLRDMLVLEDDDSLWLASGTPRRWLAPGEQVSVRDIATFFGPVTYSIHAGNGSLTANVELPSRTSYREANLVLRVPGAKPLDAVEINGKAWTDFDATREVVHLPHEPGKLKITVRY